MSFPLIRGVDIAPFAASAGGMYTPSALKERRER